MNSQNLPWIAVISFISLVKLSVAYEFPQYIGNPDEMLYRDCGGSFSCGSITGVDYPFRGNGEPVFCGYPGLVLDCKNDIATIDIKNMTFRVLRIDPDRQTMKIAREDVMESGCPQSLVNTSLDNSLFDYDSNYMNLTFLYGCPGSTIPNVSPVSCKAPKGYGSVFLFPGTLGPQSCDVSVTVPVSDFSGLINSTGTGQAIQRGFEVKWKVDSKACSECTASKGRCGSQFATNRTICYCPSEPYVSDTCGGSAEAATPASSRAPGSSKGLSQWGFKVIIGVSVSVSTIMILIITIYCLESKGTLSVNAMAFWEKERSKDQNVEAFIRQYESLAPK